MAARSTKLLIGLLIGATSLLVGGAGGGLLVWMQWKHAPTQDSTVVSVESPERPRPAPKIDAPPPITKPPSAPPAPPQDTPVPEVIPGNSKLIRITAPPPVTTNNSNQLVIQFRARLTLTASSTWPGWPTDNAVDGKIDTSWFSGQGDAAALGKRPWVQASFPTDVTVRRATILGNRDPAWLLGFTILAGKMTATDKDGKVLKELQNGGTGNYRDFDFRFDPPLEGVRALRFTSLQDQGDQTQFKDIAIAEFQAE